MCCNVCKNIELSQSKRVWLHFQSSKVFCAAFLNLQFVFVIILAESNRGKSSLLLECIKTQNVYSFLVYTCLFNLTEYLEKCFSNAGAYDMLLRMLLCLRLLLSVWPLSFHWFWQKSRRSKMEQNDANNKNNKRGQSAPQDMIPGDHAI